MKALILVSLVMLLTACGPAYETPRDSEGRIEMSPNELCLNGVVYYGRGISGGTSSANLAVKFKPDSTVETCE